MREQYVRNSLNAILNTWGLLVQIDKEQIDATNIILINSIYELFTCICQLLHLDGNELLDLWEDNEFSVDKTVDYIINNHFEVVEE